MRNDISPDKKNSTRDNPPGPEGNLGPDAIHATPTAQRPAEAPRQPPGPEGAQTSSQIATADIANTRLRAAGPRTAHRQDPTTDLRRELPVRLNQGRKTATVVFARANDFAFLGSWRERIANDHHPYRKDAVEFAQLAQSRYSLHSTVLPYAQAAGDFEDYIGDNPFCEVACLVLLRCDWFPDSDVIGLCHFRRSWSNGIILDYLCAHPLITKPPTGYPSQVSGVGSALLYFIVQVAKACDSHLIWGEATQNSCHFYENVFRLDSVKDLIYVPRAKFIEFSDRLDASWAEMDQSKPNPVLDEIYKIEADNPPFVGSKTAVFSPPRKLVQHLLELPLHRKTEVAQALDVVQDSDATKTDLELCRCILQRAAEKGRLSDLWHEVETRHPQGEPDKNPFREKR